MPLIAMTREMGSLGKDVAAYVGEALGIPVLHHEIIDHLADRMRLRKSHVIKLLHGHASFFERLTADQTSLSIYTADETLGLAGRDRGAIIRSWGAAHLLRSVPHAVCVRICSPRELRVQRMLERMNTTDCELMGQEIDTSDEAHNAIVRRHFDADWRDAEHYDLVLNTERVPIAQCVDEILRLVRDPAFAETDASRSKLADLQLAARVRAALRNDPVTRKLAVQISATGGRVALAGMVDRGEEREHAERVAAAVPGVTGVDQSLRAIGDAHSHHRDG